MKKLTTKRFRTLVITVASVAAFAALSAPAGAQQLVDAGGEKQGGLAFVLFAFMCMLIAAALFFMDRIRKRISDED